jgi:hypothetical protein
MSDPSLVGLGHFVAWCRLPGICLPDPSLSVGPNPRLLWSILVVSFSAASSSRSQLAQRLACLVARLACASLSGVVRRCPPLLRVIVTQLVTRPAQW